MKEDVLKICLAIVLLSWVIIAMCFFYVGDGCKRCPKCPEVRDSLTQAPACTLYVPYERVVVRSRVDTVRATDTLLVRVPHLDTNTIADIPDTTFKDGAKFGVTIKAKKIIPPVEALYRYTPAVDTVKKLIYHDTLTLRKNDWRNLTIASLGGITLGVAGTITGIILLKGALK